MLSIKKSNRNPNNGVRNRTLEVQYIGAQSTNDIWLWVWCANDITSLLVNLGQVEFCQIVYYLKKLTLLVSKLFCPYRCVKVLLITRLRRHFVVDNVCLSNDTQVFHLSGALFVFKRYPYFSLTFLTNNYVHLFTIIGLFAPYIFCTIGTPSLSICTQIPM
jgi:hypothetical protein